MEKKGILKKVIIISIFASLMIILFMILFKSNKYKDLEKSMLATTRSLVNNNLLEVKNSYYFTINQMGIKDTHDCSKDSGIFIRKIGGIFTYDVYLICDSYESEKVEKTKSKYITIVGANPLIVETNSSFEEPGYDSKGYRVESISSVQKTPGVYKVSYYVFNDDTRLDVVNRYVIVSEVGSKEAPIVTLNGDANMSIKIGSNYVEPGYAANDSVDGIITDKVIVTSNINSNVVGDYEVSYKVTNSKGLSTIKKRIVSVIKGTTSTQAGVSLEPSTPTKQSVNINLEITSKNYDFTILPDNTRDYTKNINFTAFRNSTYEFKIYEKNGEFITKKVLVDNIDKNPPIGSCDVKAAGEKIIYSVSASDESGIQGYSYNTDYGFTEYMKTNTFTYQMKPSNTSVIIKDMAGNTTTVSCNITKVSSITDVSVPSTVPLYVGDSYEIPITLTPSDAKKSDVSLELISGSEYVSLQGYTLKGISAGNAIIKLSVKDSTIIKTIAVEVKNKSASLDNPTPASQDVLEAARKFSDDSTPAGQVASWCGEHSNYMQAFYNGKRIYYDEIITAAVGQAVRIKLNLTRSCGTLKLLTRTSADGQPGWQEYASAYSEPNVDRYDSSTFIKVNTYDWVVTGKKSTNGKAVTLSQTSAISTNLYSEIKAFYRFKLVIK